MFHKVPGEGAAQENTLGEPRWPRGAVLNLSWASEQREVVKSRDSCSQREATAMNTQKQNPTIRIVSSTHEILTLRKSGAAYL